MNRHITLVKGDAHGMTLRLLAGVVGGLMVVGALIALLTSATVDDISGPVTCGNAFTGVTEDVELQAGTAAVAEALSDGLVSDGDGALVERCSDAIDTRRVWGYPLGALGLVALAGAFVKVPPRNPAAA